jgi:hypothetical protein
MAQHRFGACASLRPPNSNGWQVSAHMKSSDIARVTHSNHHTINRALRLSHLTGSMVRKPLQAGCPRQLTPHDVKVSLMCHWKSTTLLSQYLEACVAHTPDIYMSYSMHCGKRGMLVYHGHSRKMVNWELRYIIIIIVQSSNALVQRRRGRWSGLPLDWSGAGPQARVVLQLPAWGWSWTQLAMGLTSLLVFWLCQAHLQLQVCRG